MKLYQISSLYKINYPLESISFKNHQNVFEILPITKYSRLPITRTFKGNGKKFKLSGVRVIGSLKKISGGKVRNSFSTVQ